MGREGEVEGGDGDGGGVSTGVRGVRRGVGD